MMWLYLLLILPALLAFLWDRDMSRLSMTFVWTAMIIMTWWLMPLGSRDYTTYLRDFIDIGQLSYLEAVGQDPLYGSAVWLFGHAGGSGEFFYGALAALGLWIKLSVLRRLSGNKSVVILMYSASYFFLHDFTQIRAGLAIGIWMYALSTIETSRKRYYLLTLLASLIHIQAAIGFLVPGIFYLIRAKRGRLIISAVVVCVVAAAATRIFDDIGYAMLAAIPDPRTAVYLQLATADLWARPNPYSFISLLALATALIGLNFRPTHLRREKVPTPIAGVPDAVFGCLILGIFALTWLSSVAVAAFRISEHFFSLLPLAVWFTASQVYTKRSPTLLLFLLACLFAFIFIFYSPYLMDPAIGPE